MNEYFRIGKLVASHGLRGELIMEHSLGKKTSLKGLKAIFIETSADKFLPYFIEKTTIRSDSELLLKLEGVDTKEAARKLTPREVWLLETDFKHYSAKKAPISLLGFTILDQGVQLGEVIEVIEQPHQVLCTIMYKGKEALIPIHEDSLEKLDTRHRRIHVVLPEGLLDLYAE